jgi:hypothetical protein
MNANETTQVIEFTRPQWAAAELLDIPYADGLLLRAVICRLSAGKWQWSVMSIGDDCGELIGLGLENSGAAARQTVASEIDKCIRGPFN